MAPVSHNVVGIDDDQRFALIKFRRNVRDILRPEHGDHFLLRWLIARQWDPEAAEKMLRDSMKWREKWGVDTTLKSWEAPEVIEKYFPSGSPGVDKEGSPVIVVPFMGFDVWGLLHSVNKTEIIKMVLRLLEGYMEMARKQASTHGPNALKVVVLFDMEGFSMRHYAWKPAAELIFSLIHIYEANYPEILKTCFLVNAPKVFSLAFSVVKKLLADITISKIKIYGSDSKKWQAAVFNYIDPDQLPEHWGGTKVDENGDPKCSSIVKPGGKVPKSYFTRNNTIENGEKEYKRVTIKHGEKHTVDLLCSESESVLKWEVGVDQHDIKFVIRRRDELGESVVHGPRKVPAGAADVGVLPAVGPATYTVIFDNKNSYLKTKKIFYDVLITIPFKDLTLSETPEDCSSSH